MKKLAWLLLAWLVLVGTDAFARTIYIRTDGSNPTNCTGNADAAYDGSGTGEACAYNHPNWAFPPRGESTTGAAVDGDTVVIMGAGVSKGTGSYRIGCQNSSTCKDSTVNLTNNGYCNPSWSYDCYMNTIPNNVTITGCSTSGCGCSSSFNATTKVWDTTCTYTRPELWGAGKVNHVIKLNGASGITLRDLEITDHASAGIAHPTQSTGCSGSPASSLTALDGIDQSNSNDIIYDGVNVHGVCRYGAYGGSVGNHTYTDSSFSFNSYGGINYDSCNNDGSCGVSSGKTMAFLRTKIDWNGCIENYSSQGNPTTGGCYDQNASGYGDGIGLTNTSGTWTFTDGSASHNVSDGLDWLYGNRSGKTGFNVTIKRSVFEGNVGQCFKTDNNVVAEDNYCIANCQYFHGQSFNYGSITDCRGAGAITVASNTNSGNTTAKFYNNTITSNFDVMFIGGSSGSCSGNSFTISAKNNVLMGGADFNGGNDATSIFYSDCNGNGTATFSEDYNSCTNNFKEASPCPASHSKNNVTTANTFAGTIKQGTVGSQNTSTYYMSTDYIQQLTLKATSTAVGAADNTVSGQDSYGYGGQDRGSVWDMGALDYAAGSSPVCGNGYVEGSEACDDSNTTASDGCSATCTIETGYSCSGTPSSCSPICGDSLIVGSEVCDTANFNGATCSNYGFTSGSLSCTSCSSISTAGCSGNPTDSSRLKSFGRVGAYGRCGGR